MLGDISCYPDIIAYISEVLWGNANVGAETITRPIR
jgi:hypothetical protein